MDFESGGCEGDAVLPPDRASPPSIPREMLDGLACRSPSVFDNLRREAESQVVEWRWHSSRAYDVSPLLLERSGDVPGRLLSKTPKRMNNHSAYGIDAAGRVLVARDGEFGGRVGEYYETIYRHKHGAIEEFVFDADGLGPLVVAVHAPPDQPVLSVAKNVGGYTAQQYEWGPSGVVKISMWESGDGVTTALGNEYFISYDDDGVLVRIDRLQHLPIAAGPFQVYPAASRDRTRRCTTELRFEWAAVSPLVQGVGLQRGLLWVKDQGSYLMDPDDPSSAVWAKNAERGTSWETLTALCGADDFAQHLSVQALRALNPTQEGIRYLLVLMDLLDDGDEGEVPSPRLERFRLATA